MARRCPTKGSQFSFVGKGSSKKREEGGGGGGEMQEVGIWGERIQGGKACI